MKKWFRKRVGYLFGRKKYQKLFSKLFEVALKGLNYGTGDDFRHSGELHVLKYLQTKWHRGEDTVIFDVGANNGSYGIEAAKIFNDVKVWIYAFEPSAETFQALVHNTGEISTIIPVNVALGSRSGQASLYSNSNFSGLASLHDRRLAHFGMDLPDQEIISIQTVDEFCKHRNIENIFFIKLDVEGHEYAVLQGAKELIERNKIQFIQFEFGGCNIDSRVFFQDFFYFLSPKYKIFRVLKDGLYPINEYSENLEVFSVTNYFAQLR